MAVKCNFLAAFSGKSYIIHFLLKPCIQLTPYARLIPCAQLMPGTKLMPCAQLKPCIKLTPCAHKLPRGLTPEIQNNLLFFTSPAIKLLNWHVSHFGGGMDEKIYLQIRKEAAHTAVAELKFVKNQKV